MAEHNELGKAGEALAQQYLLKKRYTILQTNYKVRNIELDIIAKTKKTIVFVEVKTRSSEAFGMPEEAVDARKQQRIVRAANTFMQQYPDDYEARFDIIAVVMKAGAKPEIRHTEDAFAPRIE